MKYFNPPPLPGPHVASVKERKCLTREGRLQLYLGFLAYALHLLYGCRDLVRRRSQGE